MSTTRRRGMATIDDLRARSTIDPVTRCWNWTGPMSQDKPRLWALDLDRVVKTVLQGPRAVWYIAHGTKLNGRVAYMGCWNRICVCPVHVRAADRQQLIDRRGRAGLLARSPAGAAACARSAAKARAAAGIVETPPDVVLAIRQAEPGTTLQQLSDRFGISKSTASRIRRGVNRAKVQALEVTA